jgi:hypothetical protein
MTEGVTPRHLQRRAAETALKIMPPGQIGRPRSDTTALEYRRIRIEARL